MNLTEVQNFPKQNKHCYNYLTFRTFSNGKMTAAGAAGNNPFGRESQLLELGNTPNVQKSKVPFVPQDFHDLGIMFLIS